jgi:ADP-ribose pyrophosphatase
VDLVHFRHARFDGQKSGLRRWEILRRGQAAAVLPYDPVKDCVVLIEQFRLPALLAGVDPVMMEIPAGLLDERETPQATAIRETAEEAGLTPDRLERIGQFVLTPGGADEACTIFAGRVQAPDCEANGIAGLAGLADEQEDIRVHVVPAATAIENVLAGRYTNSVAAIALLWLAAKRELLKTQWIS